jgi:hypothetical protein
LLSIYVSKYMKELRGLKEKIMENDNIIYIQLKNKLIVNAL